MSFKNWDSVLDIYRKRYILRSWHTWNVSCVAGLVGEGTVCWWSRWLCYRNLKRRLGHHRLHWIFALRNTFFQGVGRTSTSNINSNSFGISMIPLGERDFQLLNTLCFTACPSGSCGMEGGNILLPSFSATRWHYWEREIFSRLAPSLLHLPWLPQNEMDYS